MKLLRNLQNRVDKYRQKVGFSEEVHTIERLYPNGLTYKEAIQLCVTFFFFSVPNYPEFQKSKEELGELFSYLAKNEYISDDSLNGDVFASLGIVEKDITRKEHWVELCLSSMRKHTESTESLLFGDMYDFLVAKANYRNGRT